ncbi:MULTISPECIES: helix-turn-helix domain-containing protein [Haloprofundus]|uniref:helix-turn-helix domain-containing protein n=1 Tax=Haloprofundus TaxID=1911573 RepID=UPI000E43F203|nr:MULTISPECIES: helix-turn-helix domain-containing protein [Haloprofundus]QCJ46413.1 helix-turn-helix domain-containing protein [Haloprofundus sp. MHR1]
MSHIAEFELSSPDLALLSTLDAAPSMRIRVEEVLSADDSAPLYLLFWATGGDFEAFEAALEDDETVLSVDVLDTFETQKLYRVRIDPDVVLYPMAAAVGASRLEITATHDSFDMRMRFPDREALAEFRRRVRERGVSFTLKRLYTPESPETTERYGLSEKQRTALRSAVRIGYFDVPRRASLDELADELGISGQAASERLRRGTVRLVRNTIEAES